jgi:hypothetical protein
MREGDKAGERAKLRQKGRESGGEERMAEFGLEGGGARKGLMGREAGQGIGSANGSKLAVIR